jgi:glycosyltransferase involved in cell wall biosynthesis
VVLFVGRLESVKGVDTLLDAFGKLNMSDTVLVLIGEGSLKEALQSRAEALEIRERVVFTGYVPANETVPFFSVADVLVLPSVNVRRGRELWGLVVNEAMNQGTPVIATESVGAAVGGLVQHRKNGEIVAERDSEQLRDAIARVVGDRAYHDELVAGVRRTIASWDNAHMIEGFLDAVAYAKGDRPGRRTKGKGNRADLGETGAAQ